MATLAYLPKKRDQVIERPRATALQANNLEFVEYIGLECVTTICNYDQRLHPYFFLFSDIDSHESEQLRRVIQVYAKARLSFYWYQTAKGWHIVSPCLLELKKWDRLRLELKSILDNYYRNLVVRIQDKGGDSSCLHWDDFNDYPHKYEESLDIHKLFAKRFNVKLCERGIRTNLRFTKYLQLRDGN